MNSSSQNTTPIYTSTQPSASSTPALTSEYFGPYNKYWSDNDCPNLKNFITSLEYCKDMCNLTDGCTTINFTPSNSACTLRGCTPGKIPTAQSDNVKGYSKYQINT